MEWGKIYIIIFIIYSPIAVSIFFIGMRSYFKWSSQNKHGEFRKLPYVMDELIIQMANAWLWLFWVIYILFKIKSNKFRYFASAFEKGSGRPPKKGIFNLW